MQTCPSPAKESNEICSSCWFYRLEEKNLFFNLDRHYCTRDGYYATLLCCFDDCEFWKAKEANEMITTELETELCGVYKKYIGYANKQKALNTNLEVFLQDHHHKAENNLFEWFNESFKLKMEESGYFGRTTVTIDIDKWNFKEHYHVKIIKTHTEYRRPQIKRRRVKKISTLIKYLTNGTLDFLDC